MMQRGLPELLGARAPCPSPASKGAKIGNGKVGPVFRRLRELYDRECRADAGLA